MKVTPNEFAVLKAYDESEYGEFFDDAIWTFSIANNIDPTTGIKPKAIPGIVASLNKKDLLKSYGYGEDAVVVMTEAGFEKFRFLNGDKSRKLGKEDR